MNRYSYVHNNPYKYVDPSGHAPAIPLWLAKFIAGSEALWAEAAVAARSVTAGGAIGLLIMPVHTAHEGDEYLGNLTFTVRNADGSLTADTSREGRREAMRQAGIPTSQQPESQSQDDAGRTYGYQVPAPGGGTLGVSVQQQPMDRSHPGQEHWEAGKVKTDSQGNARVNKHGRPQLQNDKAKVDVRENHR